MAPERDAFERDLVARLNLPPTTRLGRFRIPGGAARERARYMVEAWTTPEPDGRGRVRYVRVTHETTEASLEGLWREGEDRIEVNIRGLELDGRAATLTRLLRGRKFIDQVGSWRGRPVGSGAHDPEDILARVVAAKADLKRNRVRPTYRSIAANMGLAESTYRDYVHRYGLPGPDQE